MSRKKRILSFVLILALLGALFVGCKKAEEPVDGTSDAAVTDMVEPTQSPDMENAQEGDEGSNATATPTPAANGAAATQKPTSNTSKTSSNASNSAGGSSQAQKPSTPTQAPAQQPTPAPASTPTPPPAAPALSAQELASKMVSALPADSHNMSALPQNLYKGTYGIDPAQFESVSVYGSMMNVKANEIIVIKAKDEAGLAAAKSALENRKSALLTTWEHYLADQYALVKRSVVQTKGLYAVYVCAQNQDAALAAFQSAV